MRLRIILIAFIVASTIHASWLFLHWPRKPLMVRLLEIPDATLLGLPYLPHKGTGE